MTEKDKYEKYQLRKTYRLDKIKYKSDCRIAELKEVGDSNNRKEAYIKGKFWTFMFNIAKYIFGGYVITVSPALGDSIIKSIFGG